MIPIESKSEFKFRFLGENQISANELGEFLTETANIFNKIVDITEKDIDLKLNVVAIESGSFLITLKAMIENVPKLFNVVKDAKEITGTLKELLELKEFLRGDKIKKIEDRQLFTNNGKMRDIIYKPTYLIMADDEKRKEIDKSIARFAQKIPNRQLNFENNEDIFEITNEVRKDFMVEFDNNNDEVLKTNTQIIERELIIKKPDLTMRSQWEFVGDKVIKASIVDEEFKKYVLSGNFKTHHGHKIKVKLEERIVYNAEYEPIDTHYTILKIYLDDIQNLNLL